MKKIIISLILIAASLNFAVAEEHIRLTNGSMIAIVNSDNGALINIRNTDTGWNVIQNSNRAHSFEIRVKFPDGSSHGYYGNDHQCTSFESEADKLTFVWDGMNINGQSLDIKFTGTIEMTPEGLIFGGYVDNNSDCIIQELIWPFIGEVSVPEHTDRMLFQYVNYSRFDGREIYPAEGGMHWANLPEQSFVIMHNNKQGLYLSSKDSEFKEYIRCIYEMLPDEDYAAFVGQVDSKKNHAERNHMYVTARAARQLYLTGHSQTMLVPFVVNAYEGTWHVAADQYKDWRKTWFKTPHRAEWLEHVNSWQQLQINSSESRINFTLKDLPKYVKEAKKYGVDAIQLTGWTYGGQDRGLPCHDLDPRLGTPEQFKKIIAKAKKQGVNILLFTKFTWADLTSEYADEYIGHVAWHENADTCIHPGYNYNTYNQLLGINTRRFGIFCMEDDSLRAKLRAEFQKCLDLGAPGMVYDENQHHAGVYQCFNPNHGHKGAGFTYRGANLLGAEYLEMCKKQNPDFLMVGEGPYDIQSQYYATYTREDPNHIPIIRYIDPYLPIACAVTDQYDLTKHNMCVACRYAISYEPRCFKGHLSEIPEVMEYGMKVDRFRTRYEDYLWHGEYRDVLGATVLGEKIKYSVFLNHKNGKRALVIYNLDIKHPQKAQFSLDECESKLYIGTPEHQDMVPITENEIVLQPQGLAVIFEK